MLFIPFKFLRVGLFTGSVILALLCLSACSKSPKETVTLPSGETAVSEVNEYTFDRQTTTKLSEDDVDAYIILADDKTIVHGEGVDFENNILTVCQGGVYRLTGTLTDGKIYVNSADETKKVKLLLSGVSVSCSTDAPLYIENSPDETVLILAEGTNNSFSDTARALPSDTEDFATAAVYSKDDLQIEGSGTLKVNGNFGKGIFSKNDIDIHGGTIVINAVDDGIRGKDSVEIKDGTINITCSGDGIRTSEETEEDKGIIDISGGTISVVSQLDSIQATRDITISAGTLSLKSGGGSTGNSAGSYENFGPFGGGRHPDSSVYSGSEADTSSTKGIKAENAITVSGGVIYVDSLDDSIHSPVVTVNGGDMRLKSDDDGIHADELVTVTSGQIAVTRCYEGIEGTVINIGGGTIIVNSSDDGFNAASSDSTDGQTENAPVAFTPLYFGGKPGGMMDYNSSCSINITDGTVIIASQGDGVDSNGNVTMSGGKMIVYGPTNGGNGALDYGGSFTVSGGTLLAVGASGMAQSVTGNGVGVFDFRVDGEQDTAYAVVDADKNCLIAFTSVKGFGSVVFASDRISQSESYSFCRGGSVTDFTDKVYNICFDGVYVGGTVESVLS